MPFDPWMIDATGGAPSYAAQEARMLTVVPFVAGAGASLGVLSGIRPSGSATELLVQAQGSPNMSVLVNPGIIVLQGAISTTQGAYTWALDTTTTLTIAAAHATLARTDLVVVRIRDATIDTSGQRDAAVTVITGTAGSGIPSLPTDATYYTLAQISVPAAVTTITAARITSKRTYTAALGGTINCTSTTRPSTAVAISQRIYETDTKIERIWDGSIWRMAGPWRDFRLINSATPSVTFTVPSTLRALKLSVIGRTTASAAFCNVLVQVNNDSGATNYKWIVRYNLNGGALTIAASGGDSKAVVGVITGANAAAAHYGIVTCDIAGWNNTAQVVTFTGRGGYLDVGGSDIMDTVGLYFPSGPYTSLTVLADLGTSFVANSQIVLTGEE